MSSSATIVPVTCEPCHDEGNPECSVDKKAMLKCEGKHWKKTADCNGQHGCVNNAKGATCDQGSQEAGSACDAVNIPVSVSSSARAAFLASDFNELAAWL